MNRLSRSCATIGIAWIVFGAGATQPVAAHEPQHVRSAVSPPTAQLGERVVYRGRVLFHKGAGPSTVRWVRPDADARFTWGELAARYVSGAAAQGDPRRPADMSIDTAYVEIPLQVFDTGVVPIPGLEFEVQRGSEWDRYRLPMVELPIVPVLSAADSNAALRPLRGPLGAPWWERVPWPLLLLAGLVLAVTFFVWRWLRNRRLEVKPVPAPAPVVIDPVTEALRELSALRKLRLPQDGRFGEHALGLTRIFKRFLERATGLTRPGDTTSEVLGRLAVSAEGPEPRRIGAVMKRWDAVKFAGAESDVEEARGSEVAVEKWIREAAPPAPSATEPAERDRAAGAGAEPGDRRP